jgi:hypothetical protein
MTSEEQPDDVDAEHEEAQKSGEVFEGGYKGDWI